MLIEDTTPDSVVFDTAYTRGAEPRDFSESPREMFSAPPAEIDLIPRSEWDARIDEQEEQQSSLEHLWLREAKVNQDCRPLDQDGIGYCWNHSVAHAVMVQRLRMHQPFARLSAFAVGCKLTGYRDKGGWCGWAADFVRKNGIPTVGHWPEQSMNRGHDNEATWRNAAENKITHDFVDLTQSHWYFQNLGFDQLASMLLRNNPCPVDFNWWGHSVLAVRLVRVERGRYGIRILNSWYKVPKKVPWGENGFATLTDKRMVPDSALAVVGVTPSLAV